MILTASVGGCLTFLERFREEERQLLAMKEMLIIFEKQLEYVRLPIAEAVTDMAKKAGAPFEEPLMEFTEKILYHQTEEVERLWRECFEAHRPSFFFKSGGICNPFRYGQTVRAGGQQKSDRFCGNVHQPRGREDPKNVGGTGK